MFALAGSLVAGACGSTAPRGIDVAVESQDGPGATIADELGGDVDDGGVANAPTDPTTRRSGGGAARQQGGVSATPADRQEVGPAPAAADGRSAGPVPVGAGVPGVTDDTVFVGMVDVDVAATAAAIGAVGGAGSDARGTTRPIGDAIAAYINERGGIAGRQLKIVWHTTNPPALATAEGRRQDAQRACATWTEDNKVFAFLGQPLVDRIIYDCAGRNNVVIVPYYAGAAVDEQYFAALHRLWYSVTRMIADRRDRNLVENLVRRGVLTRDAKVGIVVEEWEPAKRSVENSMEPALAAHGIPVVAKAVFPDFIESPWDTYVLRFRSEGVTHVLLSQNWDGPGFPLLFMMRAAENQAWRPKWGLGSDNRPAQVALGGAPRAQLANAFGLGWQPESDVGVFDATGTSARCAEAAQQPLGNTSDDSWLTLCDVLFFFQAAMNHATEVSPAGMEAAMGPLGGTYESIAAIGGRTSFSPTRHDGVGLQRDFAYDPRCGNDGTNCLRYVSEAQAMP